MLGIQHLISEKNKADISKIKKSSIFIKKAMIFGYLKK